MNVVESLQMETDYLVEAIVLQIGSVISFFVVLDLIFKLDKP